jgi:glycosyltransferase involved in cell wall biosynthesis
LRLAVVSPFVDRRHGTERAVAELVDRLARQYGCQIHLYSERVEDLPLSDPYTLDGNENGKGAIYWHRIPYLPGPHLLRFISWIILNGAIRQSHRLLRGFAFDFILSPGINALKADIIIVHALFRRLQELARADGADHAQRAGFLRSLHRHAYYGLLASLERRTYSDRNVSLLAVSQRTAGLLERYFQRDHVPVIPNGVDTVQFSVAARLARRAEARRRRKLQNSDFVLLLIGNDWGVKGLPAVLRALAAVPELPLHLIVVGTDTVAPFRDMANRLGVLERCHWERPQDDAIDLYAAGDVYVSPTHEDSFGLPVAEAMACGLPVITSIFAGVAGQVHNGVDGFVLRDPDDVAALAQIFERLHRDTDFKNYIGEAAARSAQEWTWDRSASLLWANLNRIAYKHERPTGKRL